MIVESWLNEQVDSGSRGKVFGVYQMVNLTATTAGQMVLTLGDTRGYLFFVVAAMVYCMALIPTAVSSSRAPKPLVATKAQSARTVGQFAGRRRVGAPSWRVQQFLRHARCGVCRADRPANHP
jgi:hypothetical protein